MEKKTYFITTPIYYPSGNWHLGHSYTTVSCDAMARYKRSKGYDVFYLTGTDEHGSKIEKKAIESGVTPIEYTNKLVDSLKELWKLLDISYDKFIRTTDDYHVKAVQKIFTQLYEQGDIYKSKYKGKYCVPCESFWTESQLVNGKCPDCGRDVEEAEEESYFFRLSKYADRIQELLTTTDYLEPKSRVNEMVNNFLKDGLTDLAVSRTSFNWGIPVEFDKGHVVYVWIDALSNYITALGYGGSDTTLFDKYWPCDLHMVGKEIVRFHTIIWPAILMALGLELPKKVFGHGWLLIGGDKMSKSKGNVVDPFVLVSRYGIDAVRYFLLREVPFGADGIYTNESFLNRVNTDLCNDCGNLVKRTLAMSEQYFGGKVTRPNTVSESDLEYVDMIKNTASLVDGAMDKLTINKALEIIFRLISASNKYIDVNAPWILKKNGDEARLNSVMYNLLESLKVTATLLTSFLTDCPHKILSALGLQGASYESGVVFGNVESYVTTQIPALFPRLDVAKELEALANLGAEKSGSPAIKDEAKATLSNGGKEADTGKTADKKIDTKEDTAKEENKGMITIDEFFKTELKVGLVTACEKVEKADKLLKLTVTIGEEVRTIVSGIAKSYTSEEMIGKRVVVVSNLMPAKLRGIMSEGMILCASAGDKVVIVSPESVVESGSTVC